MVVSSAITDYGLNVDAYFMFNAAVAMEAYDGGVMFQDEMRHPDWQDYSCRVWPTEWYQRFDIDDARRNMTWRNRFGAITGGAYPICPRTEGLRVVG